MNNKPKDCQTAIRALAEMEINLKQQGYCLNDIFYFDLELIYGEMINGS